MCYYLDPQSTDHCTRSKAAPNIPGTPKMAHRFAASGGVLRTAAAGLTPSFRLLANCSPASAGGTGGLVIANIAPPVGIGCGSVKATGTVVCGAICEAFSAAGAGTAPGNIL